jgi:hypothetical protein
MEAWTDRKTSENLFNKHCVREAHAFLTEKGLAQKAVMLLDNAPSHPRESVLTSDDGLITVKFLSPMSQAICSPWTKE